MFPIYGMAAFLAPISRLLRKQCVWVRGAVYTGAIFLTEFITGSFLDVYKRQPVNKPALRKNLFS